MSLLSSVVGKYQDRPISREGGRGVMISTPLTTVIMCPQARTDDPYLHWGWFPDVERM